MKKLVVLSGPSCVGKGPLRAALRRHHPEIAYGELVLCNSRRPRLKQRTGPFEVNAYEVHGFDYYFLPRGLFRQLDRRRFIVGSVRSDIQAIDIEQVRELFLEHDLILAEVFHTLGKALTAWAKSHRKCGFEVRSVFLLPLSEKEIAQQVKKQRTSRQDIVYRTMKAKLERRGEDSDKKIEERALSAFWEMQDATHYTDRIVNHAGEDERDQWRDPLGKEAQRVLEEFVAILRL